jgi:kumamolisin
MPSPKRYVALQGSELIHVPNARVAGGINLNDVTEVTLFTRRGPSSPDLAARVQLLGSARASERQYLSRQEIADQYGADTADLDAIEKFANEQSLTVVAVSPGQRSIRLAGTLSNLASAFKVQFSQYQSSLGSYRGYTGHVQVPDSLSSIVKAVIGLDTKPASQYRLQKYQAAAAAAQAQSYTPNEVASLYNFPTDLNGNGQCIGILEFGGGYQMSDLNTYFQSLGIATPDIVSVSVAGAVNAPVPGQNSPDFEVMLDVEVIGAIASGAQIVVYFAPNTTLGWWRAMNTAIDDTYHNPSVISISWGGAESTWGHGMMEAIDSVFQRAGAAGITICAAAGDSGYTDGVTSLIPGLSAHVDFPASSPHVVACGGTSLQSSGEQITSETVWNDSPTSATGGGVSTVFPVPSYQAEANVPSSVNVGHQAGRGVPDVAGDADPNTGYNIRVHGQDWVIGGTSAVAPLWASLFALINQQLGTPLGFVNPQLYSEGVSGGGFHDIVVGNNGQGGYQAGPGWDACTGLGSPDGSALLEVM